MSCLFSAPPTVSSFKYCGRSGFNGSPNANDLCGPEARRYQLRDQLAFIQTAPSLLRYSPARQTWMFRICQRTGVLQWDTTTTQRAGTYTIHRHGVRREPLLSATNLFRDCGVESTTTNADRSAKADNLCRPDVDCHQLRHERFTQTASSPLCCSPVRRTWMFLICQRHGVLQLGHHDHTTGGNLYEYPSQCWIACRCSAPPTIL